jgi:hypothetical protein
MILSPNKLHDALVKHRKRLYELFVSINDIGLADNIYCEINYLTHIINQVKLFVK